MSNLDDLVPEEPRNFEDLPVIWEYVGIDGNHSLRYIEGPEHLGNIALATWINIGQEALHEAAEVTHDFFSKLNEPVVLIVDVSKTRIDVAGINLLNKWKELISSNQKLIAIFHSQNVKFVGLIGPLNPIKFTADLAIQWILRSANERKRYISKPSLEALINNPELTFNDSGPNFFRE